MTDQPVQPVEVTAYLSALELSQAISVVLGDYVEQKRRGDPIDLDWPAMTLDHLDTPQVLGQEGQIVSGGRDRGQIKARFTYRQVNAMGELLAEELPRLAADAWRAQHPEETAAGDAADTPAR